MRHMNTPNYTQMTAPEKKTGAAIRWIMELSNNVIELSNNV